MVAPLRISLGVILAVTAVFTLSSAATTKETSADQTPVDSIDEHAIGEDAALDLVWDASYLAEFRKKNPDARLVLTVTGTPKEEDGRWCIKAMTDEGTHYSTIGIYYVEATTGTITTLDLVTGEEFPVEEG
jgi:hypothetical protein